MILAIDTRYARADTDERPQPRSLALALERMGFRPMPNPRPSARWPAVWPRRRRDDASTDWRPL